MDLLVSSKTNYIFSFSHSCYNSLISPYLFSIFNIVMKKQWYEKLFENYARSYDDEPFTQGTIGEVDFIEKEINYNKTYKFLDVGCGTGRHAIELAVRGYSVTGIDLSESQLSRAKEKAAEKGVKVEFIRKDARDFNFSNKYDVIILICEGAFPLMETDEMNFNILENIAASIKKGGKFILTTLNALYPLNKSTEELVGSSNSNFDIITFRETSEYEMTDDDGNKKTILCNDRYYSPSEISWYLKSVGFSKIEIFGCRLGEFSRLHELTKDDYEMLVIAEM